MRMDFSKLDCKRPCRVFDADDAEHVDNFTQIDTNSGECTRLLLRNGLPYLDPADPRQPATELVWLKAPVRVIDADGNDVEQWPNGVFAAAKQAGYVPHSLADEQAAMHALTPEMLALPPEQCRILCQDFASACRVFTATVAEVLGPIVEQAARDVQAAVDRMEEAMQEGEKTVWQQRKLEARAKVAYIAREELMLCFTGIRRIVNLPEDARITAIHANWDRDAIGLLIESATFPDRWPGEVLEEIRLEFACDCLECKAAAEAAKPPQVAFPPIGLDDDFVKDFVAGTATLTDREVDDLELLKWPLAQAMAIDDGRVWPNDPATVDCTCPIATLMTAGCTCGATKKNT